MKGFSEVTIQNRPCVIEYKGEHYVVRYLSGRTVRMAKAAIIKKFHLHHDALDRYVAGGFKKPHCNANEDVVLNVVLHHVCYSHDLRSRLDSCGCPWLCR